MKKTISDFRVVENIHLNERHILLKLSPSDGSLLAETTPGQFAEVKIENEPSVFLRRPISIHFADYANNQLWLLIQLVGNGTKKLESLKPNEILNLVYPLGNGFTMPKQDLETNKTIPHYLLIGGGVGVAPLLDTGAKLSEIGVDVTFLLGARTANDLLELDEFNKYGRVVVTTEDGSTTAFEGEKGFVTNHSVFLKENFDAIKVCGPKVMMKAVASHFLKKGNVEPHFCEVSLENKMACGLGVCLCCVEDTKEGHKCVCSEGPVFDINDLKW